MEDELNELRGADYFASVVEERERELAELAQKVLVSVSTSEQYLGTLLQNPRANSTSLAHRQIILRRNIVRGMERFNQAAKVCTKHFLQLKLDQAELAMIDKGKEKAAQEKELRVGGLKVYEGAREFFDALYFSYGIDSHKLAALNPEEIADIASRIEQLLSARAKA